MRESSAGDQLVIEVARVMVRRAAPGETPMFGPLSRAYMADRERALASGDRGSGLLGFGPAEAVAMVTPILLEASSEVVAGLVADGLLNATKATARRVRKLFGAGQVSSEDADQEVTDDDGEADVPPLALEQWVRIRRIVRDTAMRCGMPEGQAGLLADAVMGQALLQEDTR